MIIILLHMYKVIDQFIVIVINIIIISVILDIIIIIIIIIITIFLMSVDLEGEIGFSSILYIDCSICCYYITSAGRSDCMLEAALKKKKKKNK